MYSFFVSTHVHSTLSDCISVLTTATAKDMENPVRDFFTYFDVDGDGVISEDDLHTGLDQLGNFHHVSKVGYNAHGGVSTLA